MKKSELKAIIESVITKKLASILEARASQAVIQKVNDLGLKGGGGNSWKDESGRVVARTSDDGKKLVPVKGDSPANRRGGFGSDKDDVGGAITNRAQGKEPNKSADDMAAIQTKPGFKSNANLAPSQDPVDDKKKKILASLQITDYEPNVVDAALMKHGLNFGDIMRFKKMMLEGLKDISPSDPKAMIKLRQKYGFNLDKIRKLNYVLSLYKNAQQMKDATGGHTVPLDMLTDRPKPAGDKLEPYHKQIRVEYSNWRDAYEGSQSEKQSSDKKEAPKED